MGQVIWTQPALNHLHGIMDYVAMDSPARAVKLSQRLLAAPRRLEHTPQIGRVVPEFKLEHVRELLTVRPYRIVYAVRGNTCAVIAIIHSSRDLKNVLRLEDLPDL